MSSALVSEALFAAAKARGLEHRTPDNGRGSVWVSAAHWMLIDVYPPALSLLSREQAVAQLDDAIAFLQEAREAVMRGPSPRPPMTPAPPKRARRNRRWP